MNAENKIAVESNGNGCVVNTKSIRYLYSMVYIYYLSIKKPGFPGSAKKQYVCKETSLL